MGADEYIKRRLLLNLRPYTRYGKQENIYMDFIYLHTDSHISKQDFSKLRCFLHDVLLFGYIWELSVC